MVDGAARWPVASCAGLGSEGSDPSVAWVSRARLKALDRRFGAHSSDEVADFQLRRVNEEWRKAVRLIPYYQELANRHALPRHFGSLDQFVNSVPTLDRQVLQGGVRYWHGDPRPNHRRTTGGSTATPIQLPAWRREFRHTSLDPWLARSWYGISPRDRLFLFWGHAHLLGDGWRGRANGAVRAIKDLLQNYVRHSAYDMSEPGLRRGLRRLFRSRADFLIGYSCYLDELSRVAETWSMAGRRSPFKAVIAAAEGFPAPDSVERIERLLNAPVAMEYGSVETGLIAHSHPDGGYRVFWHSYLLECHGDGGQEVLVTSLFPRCTPLFRYRLGDRFEPGDHAAKAGGCSVLSFERVLGRSNRPVVLPDGRTLHSESVSHIVRGSPMILAYQFVCRRHRVTLRVKTRGSLDDRMVASIRAKARGVDRHLGDRLEIEEVADLERTVAGKTPMVIVDPSVGR